MERISNVNEGITPSTLVRNVLRRNVEDVVDESEQTLEFQFIESCNEKLTPPDGEQDAGVSQVQYASFVILYCRGVPGSNGSDSGMMLQLQRGMQCTDTLFFFPDLPRILQLEFVQYTSCYSENVLSATEDDDITTIDDCLDEYNDQGTKFYMEDTKFIRELCTFTYPLMISTDLISISPFSNTSDAPVVQPTATAAPTIAPTFSATLTLPPTTTPMNIDTNTSGSDGLPTVGILGITITIVFVIMLAHQFCTRKFKTYMNSPSMKIEQNSNGNNMSALQEDGSVVASEHSYELGSTPITTMEDDDDGNVSSLRTTLGRNSDSTVKSATSPPTSPRRSWLSIRTPNNSSNLPHHHRFRFNSGTDSTAGCFPNSNNSNEFAYPKPLTVVTENLSDSNPVHTRKRFQNPNKSAATTTGHFAFDHATKNQSTNATMTSTSNSGNNDTIPVSPSKDCTTGSINSSSKLPQHLPYESNPYKKALSTSIVSRQQLRSPRKLGPPPLEQQSEKENSKNQRGVSNPILVQPQHKASRPRITAVTFGDVIHTELQCDTDTVTTFNLLHGNRA